MLKKQKVKLKRLKSSKVIGDFMSKYYYELDDATKYSEKKIAWCTSVGPVELLRAMGFLVYFPETHSAMLGTSRMAQNVIPSANAIGYSPEVCSYLTADIGAYIEGVSPLSTAFEGISGPPKPDILVYNTNQCKDVQDWFNFYSREYKVPVIGINSFVGVNKVEKNHIKSISDQIKALIPHLEDISKINFDIEKLKTTVALSRECSELWKEILNTASSVPSPITFFDGTTLMGGAVVGRGTIEANHSYRILLNELKDLVSIGYGAINDEKFRIYWDGMPVWGRLSAHAKLFASLKTNVLASTYCNSWIFSHLDPDDPFDSMARAYTELFIVRSDNIKEQYIRKMIKSFKIDGVIYHDAKTCPNNSNCRYGMSKRIEKLTGIPSLIINGDLNDLRFISDDQTETNIEAFVEQLEENR